MRDSGLADICNTYLTIHPQISHNLHAITAQLAFGLLELDDRVERPDVAVCKRRELHRKREASAQRAVHVQGLRWRHVK